MNLKETTGASVGKEIQRKGEKREADSEGYRVKCVQSSIIIDLSDRYLANKGGETRERGGDRQRSRGRE